MKKILLASLLGLFLSSIAMAKTDLKDLKKSIFKIVTHSSKGTSVATAFAINHDGEKFLITNNHVCDSFYEANKVVLVKSQTMVELPRSKREYDQLDNITEYYMEPGSDICIMKSKNIDQYKAIEFDSKNAEPTDDILIAGFVGRSLDLMYVEGKVYGTIPILHPEKLVSCLLTPPPSGSSGELTCTLFDQYPIRVKKVLQTAVNNIGPGFSGSPVLKDNKVVGIVSRYFQPSQGYSNGDVIFFSVSDIHKAVENGTKAMVPVTSTHYVKFIQISKADDSFYEFVEQTRQDLEYLMRRILRDLDE